DVATGAAFISVDQAGENQIAVASGANLAFDPSELPGRIDADLMLGQLEVPQPVLIEAARRTDAFFILNTAPAMPIDPELLSEVDLLILNQHEFEDYGDQLWDYKGMMAVTLGGDGAYFVDAGREIARCFAFEVGVVDTTGAGDCFSGALAVALAEKKTPEEALRFACAAGALATTQLGAQAGLPWRAAVDELIASVS
ncbi:MAG: PfkB family carbohydrate kinase, partial [Pseudomonadota bacterium]